MTEPSNDQTGRDEAARLISLLADPPALAAKANDLDSLRAAVVDSAGVGFGIWLSYIGAMTYLAVAAAGVSHVDLLLRAPVRLPFVCRFAAVEFLHRRADGLRDPARLRPGAF